MVKGKRSFLAGPATVTLSEARDKVYNSLILSGLVMIVSIPLFHYQFQALSGVLFARMPSAEQVRALAVGQSIIVFLIAFLCALVGNLYAERLSMAGAGRLRETLAWLPAGVLAGAMLCLPSFLLLDRELMRLMPAVYPASWAAGLARMAGSAMIEETVVRFGLLTICLYLLRWAGYEGAPWPAAGATALFMTMVQAVIVNRFGMNEVMTNEQIVILLGAKFAEQFVLGLVYISFGLAASMPLNFGLGLRYLVYALL